MSTQAWFTTAETSNATSQLTESGIGSVPEILLQVEFLPPRRKRLLLLLGRDSDDPRPPFVL
jgi:hypothetical protein